MCCHIKVLFLVMLFAITNVSVAKRVDLFVGDQIMEKSALTKVVSLMDSYVEGRLSMPLRNRKLELATLKECKQTLGDSNIVVSSRKETLSWIGKQFYKKELHGKMIGNGVSRTVADAILNTVKYRKSNVIIRKKQPEIQSITFDNYLDRTLNAKKISDGVNYTNIYNEEFSQMFDIFGVESEVIIALWGSETQFGSFLGNHNVSDALFTMAIDNKGSRRTFFENNLIIFAKMVEFEYFSIDQKGSWAGAMGQCQMMPSAFYAYSVNWDGNKQRNIYENKNDVFASIANYLFNIGWSSNAGILTEVILPKNFDYCKVGFRKKYTIFDWKKMGIRTKSKGVGVNYFDNNNKSGYIILPDKMKDGRAFLVYDNYKVLLDWNKSLFFATSVGIFVEKMIEHRLLNS